MLKAVINNILIIRDGTEKVLLHGIDFQLEDNKINIILGKNGTGKSTLIRGLTRLLDNRFYKISGEVHFDNTDLLTLTDKNLLDIRKSKIRYVFQDAINSFDPLKNIGFYFREFINTADLHSLLKDFLLPEGNELFKLYPYEISGGMAQRLLLVLALIAKPQILILDEPTSGIDTPISNLILLKLRQFIDEGNNSVLLVTQDLQFAWNAGDRIAYLAEGTLSPFYSPEEFFENSQIHGLDKFISAYNQLL
jgi:peptide/nickel transport system ATP-binding protein